MPVPFPSELLSLLLMAGLLATLQRWPPPWHSRGMSSR